MSPIHVLIKPASGNCNLRCKYCFYADEAKNREVASYGMMSKETLEVLVKKVLNQASNNCTFAFQGGEPTLIGLDFYRELVKMVKENNVNHLQVNYALQTNGMVIDHEWVEFLAENHFLVGLSMDGTKPVHDKYRLNAKGEGSWKTVMHTMQILTQGKVDFNVLITVTADVAKNIGKIYRFFEKNNLLFQQYIPCIDPQGPERGYHEYSLTPEAYGDFLCKLFDMWYNDFQKGKYVSIRWFDNLLGMLRGMPPESCGMSGHCSVQNVIEADGSVYPCDFYVLDEYKIGNILTDDFVDFEQKRKEIRFIEQSEVIDDVCKSCQWGPLCRGGCRRDRDPMQNGELRRNYYCESFRKFFSYAYPRLREAAAQLP